MKFIMPRNGATGHLWGVASWLFLGFFQVGLHPLCTEYYPIEGDLGVFALAFYTTECKAISASNSHKCRRFHPVPTEYSHEYIGCHEFTICWGSSPLFGPFSDVL